MFNLYDVQKGCNSLGEKSRDANCHEIRAYLEFIAARDGITIPAGAQFGARGITVGATFDRHGKMISGTVIMEMPGYGVPQIVTCDILDDAGDVVRTFPLPADKRGKLPMTAKQVQEWTGLQPVKAKRGKAAPVAPIAVDAPERAAAPWPQDYVTGPEAAGRRARLDGEDRAVPSWCSGPAHVAWLKGWAFADAYLSAMPETPASEPQDAQEALDPIECAHDAPDALHGAEIDAWRNIGGDDLFAGQEVGNGDTMAGLAAIYGADNFRVQDGCCQVRGSLPPEFVGIESRVMQNATGQGPVTLVAAPTADASDPIAAIEARLADLERAVAALSVESAADPAPTVERTKRTPAHERAIRRAWAERKARRAAVAGMNIHARRIDALELELQLANDERALDKQAIAEAYARAEQFARRGNQHRERRHRATVRARRMIAAARAHAAAQAGRASMAEAALARLKRDIADPVQPERASDLARLIQERDAARTASAALQARADRAERAAHDLAGRFEEMVSRVARAEAAVRKVMAA